MGLWDSSSSSLRAFFLLSLPLPLTDGAGRFLTDMKAADSVGGVPKVSEPPEEGEE
jgi:hypothetical protein